MKAIFFAVCTRKNATANRLQRFSAIIRWRTRALCLFPNPSSCPYPVTMFQMGCMQGWLVWRDDLCEETKPSLLTQTLMLIVGERTSHDGIERLPGGFFPMANRWISCRAVRFSTFSPLLNSYCIGKQMSPPYRTAHSAPSWEMIPYCRFRFFLSYT